MVCSEWVLKGISECITHAEGRRGRILKYLVKIKKEADKVAENVLKDVFSENEFREFSYEDVAIIGLLENIINQVKSLEILDQQNHNTSADVILRAVFENYVYLKFILEGDTALRGKAYHYSVRLSEFEMYDKLTEQTLQGRALREFVNVELDTLKEMYTEKTDVERRNKIEKEYVESIGMKWLGQNWYNLDGKTKSLKKLCNKLKMEAEYEFIYSTLSKEAHGKDAINWFDFQEFVVSIKKSNNYKDNFFHIQVASNYLIESVKEIYKYYGMKDRLKHFQAMLGVHKRIN